MRVEFEGHVEILQRAIDLEHKDWLNGIRTDAFSDICTIEEVTMRKRR